MRNEADGFEYVCDCPEGEQGRFCKHCVAVGLEYLDCAESTGMRELAGWLATLPADELVGLVMDEALRNAGVRERLLLRVSRETGKVADLSRYSRLIEHAYQVAGSESGDGLAGEVLVDVESSLGSLIEVGYAEEVAGLIEGSPVFSRAREMSGREELAGLLLTLHQESCRRCGIGGESLAARLLSLQMSADVDVVCGYEDLLGREGIWEYDRLVREEWNRLSEKIDAGQRDQYSGYERLAGIIERWAEVRGNVDLAISVKSRRLSEPSGYLEIALLCRRKGRVEEAVEWARRGSEIFQAREAVELYEFLVVEYEGRGDWREALAILLALFSARPSLEYYRRMAVVARRTGEWEQWRARAISAAPGGSVLVSILIEEGDLEAALREARSGKCESSILMDLAGRLAGSDAAEALNIYRRLVARYAEGKNAYAYEKAIEVLRRMGRLMKKQDRREEFLEYVRGLGEKYRRRHSLARMLERLLERHSRRTAVVSARADGSNYG
ncbi:MAG: hypothetical protein IPM66_22435 [Acidobacteriota bacterium]|nr:MAG: hypothetical protein IPM66_22435 [Acidobacteriota bacterium]